MIPLMKKMTKPVLGFEPIDGAISWAYPFGHETTAQLDTAECVVFYFIYIPQVSDVRLSLITYNATSGVNQAGTPLLEFYIILKNVRKKKLAKEERTETLRIHAFNGFLKEAPV